MGGGSAGYECTDTVTTLFEETVTTAIEDYYSAYAELTYDEPIRYGSLEIWFDGTRYYAQAQNLASKSVQYGAETLESGYDWSEYPFALISSDGYGIYIYTETEGSHTIKVITHGFVSVSACFGLAVQDTLKSLENADVRIVKFAYNNGAWTASRDFGYVHASHIDRAFLLFTIETDNTNYYPEGVTPLANIGNSRYTVAVPVFDTYRSCHKVLIFTVDLYNSINVQEYEVSLTAI